VQALGGKKWLWIFSDETKKAIHMSSVIGREVFALLSEPQIFAQVHIEARSQIAYSDELRYYVLTRPNWR